MVGLYKFVPSRLYGPKPCNSRSRIVENYQKLLNFHKFVSISFPRNTKEQRFFAAHLSALGDDSHSGFSPGRSGVNWKNEPNLLLWVELFFWLVTHEFGYLGFDGFGPNLVAGLVGVEIVRHDLAG
jgi:hypothetical protein